MGMARFGGASKECRVQSWHHVDGRDGMDGPRKKIAFHRHLRSTRAASLSIEKFVDFLDETSMLNPD
jgi:hypothetical protein